MAGYVAEYDAYATVLSRKTAGNAGLVYLARLWKERRPVSAFL